MEQIKMILSAASILLFSCGVLLGAVRFFRAPAEGAFLPAETAGRPSRSELAKVCMACLAAGILFQLVMLVPVFVQNPGISLSEALRNRFSTRIDAPQYINLAEYGYGAGEEFTEQYLMIVFFPLFPALLRLLNPFGVIDGYLLATLVQLPLFCWAGTGLWTLVRRRASASTAWWALAFLLAQPAAFFFFTPMTESLFLALTVTFVLLLEDSRFVLCGLVGLLAALCRSPGALLFGLALIWLAGLWLRHRAKPRLSWLAALMGPLCGLGLYFVLNRVVYGDWFKYAEYQWEHWHQKMGFFFRTVQYMAEYVQGWWADQRASAVYISLMGIVMILLQLAILAAAARRLPVHHLAYGLAYTAFTTGATWLLSAPRYAAVLFCLPEALALLLPRRWQKFTALLLMLCWAVLYLRQFLLHGPVC